MLYLAVTAAATAYQTVHVQGPLKGPVHEPQNKAVNAKRCIQNRKIPISMQNVWLLPHQTALLKGP